ncbi:MULTISPECIES: ABC transporter permease [Blautia]|uniref:ABC transporter permease n=1 Tax=Blautia TaxID=572511 RepID=UPI001D0636EA|nr:MULTISPECIES: FtsX-like permease family protein [Blautia]MCB6728840.1 FtsX-like permease family protein [Blautia obeum]MCB6740905.1 FtsX-like permease family protein [Blautia sp. 210820-DFI.6.14]MCB6958851.1 FtsX-like permease family protein [Blautia obeum]MCG4673463.1 FtsX-like permease family protein [Blautia obeum]MDE8681271.1 FtsX-like permease family protein [Blautia schinkii]
MKTISRIAYSNDKRNRTRSILIMMAICLTTMLLVIISTVGNGVIHLQKSQAAGSYGSNYGLFVSADGSQLKEVNRRAEIDATGTMCTEGIIKGNEKGGFVCMDETARKMLPYNKEYELKEGKYPEKMQEIAAGRAFFRAMGYGDVKIGDTVTLDYRAGMQSEYKPEEFVVSGILYDRDEYTIEASYVAFGSQEFYDEHVAENDRQYNIYFTLSDSANVSMNNVAPVIKEIADSCGIDQKNVIINDLYLQWVLQPSYEMIVVCGTLILGIVLFSVVVIYNIFQVGIAQKVQEYGKIKALGATRKQMKQLIFREGILLAVPSIPLGLLFGFLIAKVSFNWLVEQGNLVSSGIKNHQVPLFSLTIMLICIFVSFLTVVLALRKPMKIVSRISPIEATRYLDGSKTQKQGRRKGKKDVTVFYMAMANVTGNPKRTIATILTMGLSCVLFVIISNYVGNIDTEHEARIAINHGQFELQLDYSQNYDEAYPENNLDTILTDNPLNDSMIEEIKSIPGVTDVMTREIVSVNLNGTRFPADIVSKNDFDFMRQDGDIGSMDYDQAVKNGEIFFGWSAWMEQDGYAPGESIVFDFENGSETYTYQGKIAGSFVSADTYLVIPEGVYRSMNPRGTAYGYLWVDCDKKDVASVEQSLNTLISNTSHIKMDTYHAQLQSAEYASRMMKLGCYLFMAIVGLIGFMNLANTMIMNITTKKQEYGILQAVGMTNKQLKLCLQLQGLIFTVGTICVALIIGLPLGYALFSYAKHNGIFGMNVYHVPITPILAMILLVSLLQIVLSCVLSSNLKKETLVERIRYQG